MSGRKSLVPTRHSPLTTQPPRNGSIRADKPGLVRHRSLAEPRSHSLLLLGLLGALRRHHPLDGLVLRHLRYRSSNPVWKSGAGLCRLLLCGQDSQWADAGKTLRPGHAGRGLLGNLSHLTWQEPPLCAPTHSRLCISRSSAIALSDCLRGLARNIGLLLRGRLGRDLASPAFHSLRRPFGGFLVGTDF